MMSQEKKLKCRTLKKQCRAFQKKYVARQPSFDDWATWFLATAII
jgi:hypothetical protein